VTCFQDDLWDESQDASQQAYDENNKKSVGKTFMSRITKPISKMTAPITRRSFSKKSGPATKRTIFKPGFFQRTPEEV
jgi:hypothetical protein